MNGLGIGKSQEQQTKTHERIKSKARSREALSPIFATLIILAVVTVLFIPVFIWATGMTSQTQESWQTSGLIATERIVIEEVNLNVTAQNCTVYVRNIGKTAITINDVLIVDPDGQFHTYEETKNELETVDPGSQNPLKSIIQGELIEIDIAELIDLTLSEGKQYTVKVFTTRGVGDTYQARSPIVT